MIEKEFYQYLRNVRISYPNSIIYNVDNDFKVVKHEDTEYYQVMKRFLNNSKGMLNLLLDI